MLNSGGKIFFVKNILKEKEKNKGIQTCLVAPLIKSRTGPSQPDLGGKKRRKGRGDR